MKKESKLPDGRKYRLAIILTLMMVLGFGLAGYNPVLIGLYSQLLTGFAMIYGIYCGGNIGNKWVQRRDSNGIEQCRREETISDRESD